VPRAAGWARGGDVSQAGWTATDEVTGWGHLVDQADAVVNLAGESIGDRRWSDARKQRLIDSRVVATRGIGRALQDASRRSRVLINASAVGYYGSRADEVLSESSAPGGDFLARVCIAWEDEARRAAAGDTRLALLRTGLVLDRQGGALARMLLPFRLGLGGPVGPGTQYWSWVHRADWVAMVRWLLEGAHEGAFNLTAPAPVTNLDFSRALGQALGRPALLTAPAFALRLALGEMADALLLSSQRAVPQRAIDLGFRFAHVDLRSALDAILRV
jgi:hypothetical protein